MLKQKRDKLKNVQFKEKFRPKLREFTGLKIKYYLFLMSLIGKKNSQCETRPKD